MPEWIHGRAKRLQKEMEETYPPKKAKQVAFAVATQQAHAAGKAPKTFRGESFGTLQGKREAKRKFDRPRSSYDKTASPLPAFHGMVGNQERAMSRKVSAVLTTTENHGESPAGKEKEKIGMRQQNDEKARGVMEQILGIKKEGQFMIPASPVPTGMDPGLAAAIGGMGAGYASGAPAFAGAPTPGMMAGATRQEQPMEMANWDPAREVTEPGYAGYPSEPVILARTGPDYPAGPAYPEAPPALGPFALQEGPPPAVAAKGGGGGQTAAKSTAGAEGGAKTGSLALKIRMAALQKQGQGSMDLTGGGSVGGSGAPLRPRAPLTPPTPPPSPPPPTQGGGTAASAGVVPATNPMTPTGGLEDFGTLLENVQERAFQDAKAKYAQEDPYAAQPTLGERFKKLREKEIGILPGGLAFGAGIYGGGEAVKALREHGAQLAAERRAGIRQAKAKGKGIEAAKGVKAPWWAKETRWGQIRGAGQLPFRKSFVPRRAVRWGIRAGAPLAAFWGAKGLLGREKQGADMAALVLQRLQPAGA